MCSRYTVCEIFFFIRQALVRQADEFAGRPEFFAFKLVDYGKNLGMGSWDDRWALHRKLANRATKMFVDNKVGETDHKMFEQRREYTQEHKKTPYTL